MNHCISASCSSRDKVEGWNSSSTQRSAAAMSAHAALGVMRANAATVPSNNLFIGSPPFATPASPPASSPTASHPSEHENRVDERQAESPVQVRAHQPEPRKMNERAAEQRNEQPVAAGRIE